MRQKLNGKKKTPNQLRHLGDNLQTITIARYLCNMLNSKLSRVYKSPKIGVRYLTQVYLNQML